MAFSFEHEAIYSNVTSYWPSFLNNASNYTVVYDNVVNDMANVLAHDYQKWVYSITGCLLVGLSGIFPLLIFPGGDCSPNADGNSDRRGKLIDTCTFWWARYRIRFHFHIKSSKVQSCWWWLLLLVFCIIGNSPRFWERNTRVVKWYY